MGAFGVILAATLSACEPYQPATIPVNEAQPAASPKDSIVQIFIPAGKFEMGSDLYRDETPSHLVQIDHFWIDRTEVTNAGYLKCVEDNVCQWPVRLSSYTHPEYFGNPRFDAYPVIYVNWNDADTFCRWAGRRLPTEAEWERAARGFDGRLYPWGDQVPEADLLDFDFTVGDTAAVGSYPRGASPYGVFDMAGNVSEWVADWFETDYYSHSPLSDPGGPVATQYRVVRGGSWWNNRNEVRAGLRVGYPPDSAFLNLGFRCAESAWAPGGLAGAGGHRPIR